MAPIAMNAAKSSFEQQTNAMNRGGAHGAKPATKRVNQRLMTALHVQLVDSCPTKNGVS